MTKRSALEILIRHAAADCHGSGVGISSIPSDKEIALVKEAIKKIWKEAFPYDTFEDGRFNLGI
jgi:hypothetical protein